MGLSQHMVPDHGVLLNIIRLEPEGSDRIINHGQTDIEQRDKKR